MKPRTRQLLLLGLCVASARAAELQIHEIRIDQPGPDLDEFFELLGPAGAGLDGLSYLVLGDDDADLTRGCGIVEARIDLSGLRLDANGLLCVADPQARCTASVRRGLNFENNDSVTHLLVRDCTAAIGDDLDRDDDGQLDSQPWTERIDAVAVSEGRSANCAGDEHVYAATVVWPRSAFSAGYVRRCGEHWIAGDFDWPGQDTPGQPNACGEASSAAATPVTRR